MSADEYQRFGLTSCPLPFNLSFCLAVRRNLGMPGCESRLRTTGSIVVDEWLGKILTGPRPASLPAVFSL